MKRIIALSLILALAGCAEFGAKVQADLAAIAAWIKAAEAKVEVAIAPTFQDVCMGIGVLESAFAIVAPAAGASASDIANEHLAVTAGNTLCAKPPTDVNTAIAQGISVYKSLKDATNAVAPGALAAAASTP